MENTSQSTQDTSNQELGAMLMKDGGVIVICIKEVEET
jgi:hypothetical protein